MCHQACNSVLILQMYLLSPFSILDLIMYTLVCLFCKFYQFWSICLLSMTSTMVTSLNILGAIDEVTHPLVTCTNLCHSLTTPEATDNLHTSSGHPFLEPTLQQAAPIEVMPSTLMVFMPPPASQRQQMRCQQWGYLNLLTSSSPPSTTCLKIRQQRIHLLHPSLVVMGTKILGGHQMFSPPTSISLQERPYRTVVVELITVLSFTFKQPHQRPKMMCQWWGCNFLTSPSSPPSQPHSMRQQIGWPPSNGHLLTMKEPHHHSSITQWRGCFLPDITTPCMAWPAWCVITPASKRGHTEQW